MILDKNVCIVGHSKNVEFYRGKGYDIRIGTKVEIKPEDLSSGSTFKIRVCCDNCGIEKSVVFKDYYGYTDGLSKKYYCNKKECKTLKIKDSCVERYGVDNVMKVDSVKENLKNSVSEKYGVSHYSKTEYYKERYKTTCLEKYGVENPFQSEFIKDKIKNINIERYGVKYPMMNKDILNKAYLTTLMRYGVGRVLNNKDVYNKMLINNNNKWGVGNMFNIEKSKLKLKETFNKKYGEDYPFLSKNFMANHLKNKKNGTISIYKNKINNDYQILDYNDGIFNIKHNICDNISDISKFLVYSRHKYNVELCPICNPIEKQTSFKEKEICEWLKSLNIEYIESDRDILDGKELDIYIPSKKLAIEFNGLYWHSEKFKYKKYHLEKSLKCVEQGIQLLHIWEDEWVFKDDIVKSVLMNRLGLITNKIYARDCELKVVSDGGLVREFLNSNHIQGYSQSSIKLGLYYKEEMVSLMTFGYRHTNTKKEFELIRFCNKKFVNVVGAASKLFKFFKQNYRYDELISYSDFRLFDGEMYKTLGFTKQHLSKPDYFWCNSNLERKHRFNFNKKKLVSEGYDSSKTEVEIMHSRGYYRIYGCGQYRWIYKNVNL